MYMIQCDGKMEFGIIIRVNLKRITTDLKKTKEIYKTDTRISSSNMKICFVFVFPLQRAFCSEIHLQI